MAYSTIKGLQFATATGPADNYVTTLPSINLVDGFVFELKINTSNLGPSTLNVNATGVKSLVNTDLDPLVADDIEQDSIYLISYNTLIPGGGWQVMGLAKAVDPVTAEGGDFGFGPYLDNAYVSSPNGGELRVTISTGIDHSGVWNPGDTIQDDLTGAQGLIVTVIGTEIILNNLSGLVQFSFLGGNLTNLSQAQADTYLLVRFALTIYTVKPVVSASFNVLAYTTNPFPLPSGSVVSTGTGSVAFNSYVTLEDSDGVIPASAAGFSAFSFYK